MRRSGKWQSVWDDRILEWLRENDGDGTPKQIHDSGAFEVTRQHVAERLRTLADHGLVRRIGNGAYSLTEEGEGYLDEEYDARNERWMNQNQTDGPESAPSGPTPEEAGNGGDGGA